MESLIIDKATKIIKKKIISEKDYFSIIGSHDGYLKEYGIIHERQIEFFTKSNKFIGKDRLIKKKILKALILKYVFTLNLEQKLLKHKKKNYLIELLIQDGDFLQRPSN